MAGGNKGDFYVPRVKVGDGDEQTQGPGGSGIGGAEKDPCNITHSLNLSGTDDVIARQLKIGSCLEIHLLRQSGAPQIAATFNEQVVGYISGLPTLSRLTNCLESGVPFKATVVQIHLPGMVKVKLERGECL